MKYIKNTFILFIILSFGVTDAQTITFTYTGAPQTWTVPCGVTAVTVDMAGAEGGNSTGTGGRVQCVYVTTPGTLFNIYVGGQGAAASSGAAGGWNGGGSAGIATGGSYGSGGGGASDIRVGGTALTDRVIVAGGGGGINTDNNNPGLGGGLTGGNSNGCCSVCFTSWATGGTQSAGGSDAVGSGTCCVFTPTPDGSLGVGGDGAGPSTSCNNGDAGGGGGGGYYGGGGGGGYGSGAGGSSYTNASCSNVIHTQGYQSGNGYVTLKWNALAVSANIITNVFCNADSNGVASGKISGGTLPYTYSWAPGGETTDTISGLKAGIYILTVSDSCGNSLTAAVTITQPGAISMAKNSSPDDGTGDGAAWVTVTGGTSPYTYLWSPGVNTTDSVYGKSAGSYCCTVTDANRCTDSVCVTISSTAGINNMASGSSSITIYPNPSNGQFTIQSSVVSGQSSVEIYNMLGEKVYSQPQIPKGALNEINLSSQPNGIYLYRVIKADGSLLGEGKLIIQK